MQILPFERRRRNQPSELALKRALTADQLATLLTLERFGWTLRFIRRNGAASPIAALYDPDHQRFAVLEADGQVNTSPAARFRLQ